MLHTAPTASFTSASDTSSEYEQDLRQSPQTTTVYSKILPPLHKTLTDQVVYRSNRSEQAKYRKYSSGSNAQAATNMNTRPAYGGYGYGYSSVTRSQVYVTRDWQAVPVAPRRPQSQIYLEDIPKYSRKVFVGGLPSDVNRQEVAKFFEKFGEVVVDWPREAQHPKEEKRNGGGASHLTGYVFLIYMEESSVASLISNCVRLDQKHLYILMSSPTVANKFAQVRPWELSNINYIPYPLMPIEPRTTVFVGGVPRPTTAVELATLLSVFGTVIYAGVDIDPELRYPKGAARVTFATVKGYIAAIKGKYVRIDHLDQAKKEVEIKPYVMDNQDCDQCGDLLYRNGNVDTIKLNRGELRPGKYFCGSPMCLQYFCHTCWDKFHVDRRSHHKPLVRQGDQTKELSELPRVSDMESKEHHSGHRLLDVHIYNRKQALYQYTVSRS